MSVDMNKAVNNGYSDTSIEENEGPKGLRKRPATLLGSDGIAGCTHAIFEIIANAIDEYRQGYGKEIRIIVEEDNTVTIIDHGRGVPMGYNEKSKKFNWELVFCTLYASGKGGTLAYSSSEGLNGIGCTAAQYTSDFMEVKVNRVNDAGKLMHYEMNFKNGYPVGSLIETPAEPGAQTGTYIRFRPSVDVFLVNNVSKISYTDKLRKKAMVVPGARLVLEYKNTDPEEFCFEKGMAEFVDGRTSEGRWTKEVLTFSKSAVCNDYYIQTGVFEERFNYDGSVNGAITFVKEVNTNLEEDLAFIEVYHNGAILSQGGMTMEAIVSAVIKVFTQAGRELGKLQKNESIKVNDVIGLIAATSETRCPSEMSRFENQTKVALKNDALVGLTEVAVVEGLNTWRSMNPKEFDKVLEQIMLNKSARDKAASIKKETIRKLTQDIHKIGKKPEKLLPAKCKDPSKCEIFIIEGDSAKGAVSSARDGETQAVFPLRGKIPNCLKKGFEFLLKSEIILNLLTILGCGIETEDKFLKDLPEFDINKLNYNKIIITTDADVDGGHITCLLLVFMLRFIPSVIRYGHVYLALSPLFFIDYGKGEKLYAYSDAERDKIINKLVNDMGIPKNKISVQRSKGLGENSEDDMYNTVLNPATRRLVQIGYPKTEEERYALYELCDQLLGNDLDARRELIKEYFSSVRVIEE